MDNTAIAKPSHARRGATVFAVTTIAVFVVTAWLTRGSGRTHAAYFLAAGPLSGIALGLIWRRAIALPTVLALWFTLVSCLLMYPDPRSTSLVDVASMGIAMAFLFWCIGASASLTLPENLRFAGGWTFAVPAGIAGIIFQFLNGPAAALLKLSQSPAWQTLAWDRLVLWLIAGTGGAWLFGAELDRMAGRTDPVPARQGRSRWAVVSVATGAFGLGIGLLSVLRATLPLDLFAGLSPVAAASDWMWSWAMLVAALGLIALIQTLITSPNQSGRLLAVCGLALALVLVFSGSRLAANPWRAQFNRRYAEKLLARSDNPEYDRILYTGNLILAQAAVDSGDLTAAGQHLAEAVAPNPKRELPASGPDTSVARVLLQRGAKDAVMQYFQGLHAVWPEGEATIRRWETALRAGRNPNFNTRGGNNPGGVPPPLRPSGNPGVPTP